jgi:hypothetical protein
MRWLGNQASLVAFKCPFAESLPNPCAGPTRWNRAYQKAGICPGRLPLYLLAIEGDSVDLPNSRLLKRLFERRYVELGTDGDTGRHGRCQRVDTPEQLGSAGEDGQTRIVSVTVGAKIKANDLHVFFQDLVAIGLGDALLKPEFHLLYELSVSGLATFGGV